MLFINFILGLLWYIFSKTTHLYKFGESDADFDDQTHFDGGYEEETFLVNSGWSMAN